jgi:hypothetical protein
VVIRDKDSSDVNSSPSSKAIVVRICQNGTQSSRCCGLRNAARDLADVQEGVAVESQSCVNIHASWSHAT